MNLSYDDARKTAESFLEAAGVEARSTLSWTSETIDIIISDNGIETITRMKNQVSWFPPGFFMEPGRQNMINVKNGSAMMNHRISC